MSKEKSSQKAILNIIEDIKDIQQRISGIDKETCTEKTLHILDEAYDSIDLALRMLNHIDLEETGGWFGRTGGVALGLNKNKRRRITEEGA